MVAILTNKLYANIKANIPSRILSFNDKDPPWITRQVKTAIKRKRGFFRKFMNSGRRPEDWQIFKTVRNETSRLVVNAKEMYYRNLGRKLSVNILQHVGRHDTKNGGQCLAVIWGRM